MNKNYEGAVATSVQTTAAPLLELADLRVSVYGRQGKSEVVHGVDLQLQPGKTIAIVGESGSGKSMTANAIMGILPEVAVAEGTIRYRGQDILDIDDKAREELSGPEIGYIFQEPMSALHPTMTIGEQMVRPIRKHLKLSKRQARDHASRLLDKVGIPPDRGVMKSYVHQLSGGMRQRVMIAMSISCNPSILIADEPTTALDATIQKQILEMLDDLRDELQLAVILISHDLGLVSQYADDVVVMFEGNVMEKGPISQVIGNPESEYTKGLLAAAPKLGSTKHRLPVIDKKKIKESLA